MENVNFYWKSNSQHTECRKHCCAMNKHRLNCRNARRTNENETETLFLFFSLLLLPCLAKVSHFAYLFILFIYLCVEFLMCTNIFIHHGPSSAKHRIPITDENRKKRERKWKRTKWTSGPSTWITRGSLFSSFDFGNRIRRTQNSRPPENGRWSSWYVQLASIMHSVVCSNQNQCSDKASIIHFYLPLKGKMESLRINHVAQCTCTAHGKCVRRFSDAMLLTLYAVFVFWYCLRLLNIFHFTVFFASIHS